jgi:hypothetical protein
MKEGAGVSYSDGWAAINLAMPKRIPRTEYSAEGHWGLIRAVTGIEVGVESPTPVKRAAGQAFMRAWDYDFFWSTLIGRDEFGEMGTDMGHAEYAAGGVDRRDTIHCPYEDPEEVLAFDPWEALGERDRGALTRRFEAHYRANCEAHDFGVNMTGIYVTLVSGFIDLFGWEMLLLAAGTDLARFGALANRYASWVQQYFDALAEADVPVVMVHDDIVWAAGAIFRPAWYREYVFPNYRKYFAPLLESGKRIMFCSDGDLDAFVDDIADAGVHGFVFEPLTDLAAIVERYGQTHVIVGNVDTRVLLTGSRAAIRAEVERCLSLGRACPGYFLAVGNHIPPNTPVENALYYNQVYEELGWR